ncbi:MAG: hypothetical protein JXA33_04860, partial [Anaerolineae bacterium]|nr:hypothetical protein [Anaerolineae bacterium]
MYDVDFMKDLIRSAGTLAMEHFLKVKPAWKANQTYVTDADLAVQEYLKKRLDAHFPDDGIIAEEYDLQKPPTVGERYWVIDPIDGTSAFAAGLPVWGIAIGLVEGGDPIGGFFLLPTTGDLFYTTPDGQVWRNERSAHLKTPEPLHRESVLLTVSRFDREY